MYTSFPVACDKALDIFGDCWWTKESPRAHVAKFYSQLRLIRRVLRASKRSVLKLTDIVILWVYYTIPFGFTWIWHFCVITLQFLNYFRWLRITDVGSVPEMRIWSIFIIESDLKWCIHRITSLFSYIIDALHKWTYGKLIGLATQRINIQQFWD